MRRLSVTALNDEGIGAVIKLQVTAVDRKQPITILEAEGIRFSVRDGQRVTAMLSLTTARLSAANEHLEVPRFRARHESGDYLYVEKYLARAAALLRALAKPPIAIALHFDEPPGSANYQVTDALSSSDAQTLDRCLTDFADAFR